MLARLQRQALMAEQARVVARALGESVGDDRIVSEPPTNGGDEERLRGIPAIGRGVSGAIRGTKPEGAIHRIERHLDRQESDARREQHERRHAKTMDRLALRRARMSGVDAEKVDRMAIIERDDSTCYLCGVRVEHDAIHLDHVVPLALGGAHRADNLAVTCGPCNQRKGASPPRVLPATIARNVG